MSLDKPELRRFGKFVRSPFFTHRSEMERMYAYLARCRYADKALPGKELLFQKSFPGRAYDDLLASIGADAPTPRAASDTPSKEIP